MKVTFTGHWNAKTDSIHVPRHVTCNMAVSNNHILGISISYLPIHISTCMGLWLWLMVTHSWACPVLKHFSVDVLYHSPLAPFPSGGVLKINRICTHHIRYQPQKFNPIPCMHKQTHTTADSSPLTKVINKPLVRYSLQQSTQSNDTWCLYPQEAEQCSGTVQTRLVACQQQGSQDPSDRTAVPHLPTRKTAFKLINNMKLSCRSKTTQCIIFSRTKTVHKKSANCCTTDLQTGWFNKKIWHQID